MQICTVASIVVGMVGSVEAVSAGFRYGKNASTLAAAVPHAATQLHATKATTNKTMTSSSSSSQTSRMPCQCQTADISWQRCTRTVPKCIFVDLGAADGNSFHAFLNGDYGALANCPSGGAWEALLVEANPRFKAPLEQAVARFPDTVKAFTATAAYMCEGQTSFFLDTTTTAHNYWGSSMASNHPDVVNSGKQKVTVNTLNLNRLLLEQTIPGDYVLVKMDIEGAEFDIVPCLSNSPSVALMDALWMEQHDPSWGLAGNSLEVMNQAKAALSARGVYMPEYFSQTLLQKVSEVRPRAQK